MFLYSSGLFAGLWRPSRPVLVKAFITCRLDYCNYILPGDAGVHQKRLYSVYSDPGAEYKWPNLLKPYKKIL